MDSSQDPQVPSVLHGASSVPRNLDTITASEETVAGKRMPLTRKGPPSSVKRAGSVATNPARRNSLIRHSTSANLARAFFWNRSKEVSSTPDNSTLALNKARSLMIQLLTPQLSLKDNKALLDLATLCWLGGKGVQDFVGREGGLNEISRLLEERVRGFSSSEQEVPASPKRPAGRGRRRRLSFDSIKTSPQLIKRSAKSPKVGADLVVAALSLLETLCRGHEKNQKEILRLGYIDTYEKLMGVSNNVREKVWATHCTLLLLLNNPQAQSRFTFAYNASLKPRLRAISLEDYWASWSHNSAKELIILQEKFT